jgi:ATP-dependent RNA helicase MSS116
VAGVVKLLALKWPAGTELLEIHSDLPDGLRKRNDETFRRATRAIMFASDVAARGVDYPNVSLVVRMGTPDKQDTYVHSVGRTGRAGKSGESALVLCDFEADGAKKVLGGLGPAKWDTPKDKDLPDVKLTPAIKAAMQRKYLYGYKGWMGAYCSMVNRLKVSRPELDQEAAKVFRALGCDERPGQQ